MDGNLVGNKFNLFCVEIRKLSLTEVDELVFFMAYFVLGMAVKSEWQ